MSGRAQAPAHAPRDRIIVKSHNSKISSAIFRLRCQRTTDPNPRFRHLKFAHRNRPAPIPNATPDRLVIGTLGILWSLVICHWALNFIDPRPDDPGACAEASASISALGH